MDVNAETQSFIFKVSVLGDSNAGKSTLVGKRVNAVGLPKGLPPAIHIKSETLELGDMVVKVQYLDTKGDREMMKLTCKYCAGTAGVIYVFDVGDARSFVNVQQWISEYEKHKKNVRILVGNKNDTTHRQVSAAEALDFAAVRDMRYFETSATGNIGIDDPFDYLIEAVLEDAESKGHKKDVHGALSFGNNVVDHEVAIDLNDVVSFKEKEVTTKVDWLHK
eukprot:Phypoly_transcript_14877.p1 GENE.Phypoly_transcript_14877~~Phypoly_transcript_14877.p1  ORF type:complete len:221 (+),score=42.82 Phypoly_transcript_14877:96-758(+)